LDTEHPFNYVITSPKGIVMRAKYDSTNTYRLAFSKGVQDNITPDTATLLAIVATTRRSKKTNSTSPVVNPATNTKPTIVAVDPQIQPTPEKPIQTSVPNPKPQLAKKSMVVEDGLFKLISNIKSSQPHSLWEWHVALRHLNYCDVLYMASKPDSGVIITGNHKQPTCHICIKAKSKHCYSYQATS
jgi:hypothetical protein